VSFTSLIRERKIFLAQKKKIQFQNEVEKIICENTSNTAETIDKVGGIGRCWRWQIIIDTKASVRRMVWKKFYFFNNKKQKSLASLSLFLSLAEERTSLI
jgi:hypothetical protein